LYSVSWLKALHATINENKKVIRLFIFDLIINYVEQQIALLKTHLDQSTEGDIFHFQVNLPQWHHL